MAKVRPLTDVEEPSAKLMVTDPVALMHPQNCAVCAVTRNPAVVRLAWKTSKFLFGSGMYGRDTLDGYQKSTWHGTWHGDEFRSALDFVQDGSGGLQALDRLGLVALLLRLLCLCLLRLWLRRLVGFGLRCRDRLLLLCGMLRLVLSKGGDAKCGNDEQK